MRVWLIVLAILAPCAAPALADPPAPDALRAGAAAVRDRALGDSTAYDYIESLSVDVGQRLAGSEATPRATAWAEAELTRSEEHTSELQSQSNLVCRLLL